MAKIVFHAFSAYVGTVTGKSTCSFWTDDPASPPINWNAGSLVPIDLSRTPSAARASGNWANVDVDDHVINGGFTTIGPLFPGGTMIGAAWLSEDFMNRNNLKAKKPGHAHDHELIAIAYDGDKQLGNRRFQGFHARVGNTQGALTRVEVWTAGTGRSGNPVGAYLLDLNAVAHPVAAGASVVGPASAPGHEGALFLDTAMKNTYTPMGGGTGPKVPPATGFDY
jgi:hypothetical protein